MLVHSVDAPASPRRIPSNERRRGYLASDSIVPTLRASMAKTVQCLSLPSLLVARVILCLGWFLLMEVVNI